MLKSAGGEVDHERRHRLLAALDGALERLLKSAGGEVDHERRRLTYTFTLRRGIKFHNGKDLTADDVVASLQRWGRVATRGRALVANVVSVTAADPYYCLLHLHRRELKGHVNLPTHVWWNVCLER